MGKLWHSCSSVMMCWIVCGKMLTGKSVPLSRSPKSVALSRMPCGVRMLLLIGMPPSSMTIPLTDYLSAPSKNQHFAHFPHFGCSKCGKCKKCGVKSQLLASSFLLFIFILFSLYCGRHCMEQPVFFGKVSVAVATLQGIGFLFPILPEIDSDTLLDMVRTSSFCRQSYAQ